MYISIYIYGVDKNHRATRFNTQLSSLNRAINPYKNGTKEKIKSYFPLINEVAYLVLMFKTNSPLPPTALDVSANKLVLIVFNYCAFFVHSGDSTILME